VEESRAQLLARRAEVESLTERIIAQQGSLQTARNQASERRIEADRTRSQLAGQRAALAEQRSALARQDVIVLTAPSDGVVEQAERPARQRASPDAPLLAIVRRRAAWKCGSTPRPAPPASSSRARKSPCCSTASRTKLRRGRGRIAHVDSVAVDPATLARTWPPQSRCSASASRSTSCRGGARPGRLRAGMTLTGNVILARRKLWEMLFNPFVAALDG
jgi:hypothetical protein